MTKVALYRHFDAAGTLLYVGITAKMKARQAAHAKGAPWAAEIAKITHEWLPTREEALAAEAMAIRDEAPRFNRYRPRDMATAGPFQRGLVGLMESTGTTSAALAQATGVSVELIMKLRGRPTASTVVETAIKLARFFGMTAEDVIAMAPPEAQEAPPRVRPGVDAYRQCAARGMSRAECAAYLRVTAESVRAASVKYSIAFADRTALRSHAGTA